MSKQSIDLYGSENVRMFGAFGKLLEKAFLERCLASESDQSHLRVEDFDPEPWCRYVKGLGASMIEETDLEGEGYVVCHWDGRKARAADKDGYNSYVVSNPNIGPAFIIVPKELALRILALGTP